MRGLAASAMLAMLMGGLVAPSGSAQTPDDPCAPTASCPTSVCGPEDDCLIIVVVGLRGQLRAARESNAKLLDEAIQLELQNAREAINVSQTQLALIAIEANNTGLRASLSAPPVLRSPGPELLGVLAAVALAAMPAWRRPPRAPP